MGDQAANDYERFANRSERLFNAFDAPMMQTAAPSMAALIAKVLPNPALIKDMGPHQTLERALAHQFKDSPLAQLFGRYATYVGGSPKNAPAILSLIAHAEASGVWRVDGGFHALPRAIEALAKERGATLTYGADVRAIDTQDGRFTVKTDTQAFTAEQIVFNGDPRALQTGSLGTKLKPAVPKTAVEPRSLSAAVLSFAAKVKGPALSHHTVFFADEPNAEFDAIALGQLPSDATLYVCAEDHGTIAQDTKQRFEIILNAPAGLTLNSQEKQACLTHILRRLSQFGLSFDPEPTVETLTLPQHFDQMFPASQGSLYGRSPNAMT
ncbi:MAG: FAD-dependent oxidoreductase, partial [Marinomonas sp.]